MLQNQSRADKRIKRSRRPEVNASDDENDRGVKEERPDRHLERGVYPADVFAAPDGLVPRQRPSQARGGLLCADQGECRGEEEEDHEHRCGGGGARGLHPHFINWDAASS